METQSIQIINEELYDKLPAPLKRGVGAFNTEFEQHLFLYGAITVASGLFNRVKGKYFQRDVNVNLYLLCLSGPATLKGALLYSNKLSEKVHRFFLDDSMKRMQEYQQSLKDYNLKKKKDPTIAAPLPKGFRIVNYPVNITSSKMLQQLAHNEEGRVPSIIFSTEIDGLTVNSSDWSVISELLRKAYHGEPISYARKTNLEYYEIPDPSIAVALSGTHDQLYALIKSAQNGLYSRFLVLQSFQDPVWSDVRPCEDCPSLSDVFEELSNEFFQIWKFTNDNAFEFRLNGNQWDELNKYCEEQMQLIVRSQGEDALSIIKRHGLMIFKIAAVLTCFHRYEWKVQTKKSYCLDIHFNMAIAMVDQSLRHSLNVYETLPGSQNTLKSSYKEKFFSLLAPKFERKDAIEIGRQFGISVRTIDRCLKEFVSSGLLESLMHGTFAKN